MAHSKRQRRSREERANVPRATVDGKAVSIEGVGYKGTLGMVTMIREPLLRVVFCNLSPELRNAWCRTPGALYRPGLIPRLAAGLVTFDAGGKCAT